jgi:hypothetical protein
LQEHALNALHVVHSTQPTLLLLLLLPLQELTPADVERFRSDETISQFFDQLSSSYPELIAPLIAGEAAPALSPTTQYNRQQRCLLKGILYSVYMHNTVL